MLTETQFAIFNKFRLGILCKDGLHADGGSCDCSTHVPALASPTDNGARAVQTQQASLTETNASGAENTSRSRWPPCEHNRQSGAPTSSIALWHGGQWRWWMVRRFSTLPCSEVVVNLHVLDYHLILPFFHMSLKMHSPSEHFRQYTMRMLLVIKTVIGGAPQTFIYYLIPCQPHSW